MSKPVFVVLFLVSIALAAVLSETMQRSGQRCMVDNNTIEPITRVLIIRENGEELQFCSLCCARQWLDAEPDLAGEIRRNRATLTVVDEISGEPLDSSVAYWLESDSFSRRENKCRVHVFKKGDDAAAHILAHSGREIPGYLAGQGEQLDWAVMFTAPDLIGEKRQLSDFRGKVVFLRFWNTGNPFTAQDLADLERAQLRFREKGFTILALNVEQEREEVAAFTADLNLTFPVLLDPDGKIADRYGVSGYPTGFLIDRAGIIANRVVGELTPEVMAPLLYPLW